ncbi:MULTISPECIES: TrbG/VirB9 family P-type conjugative transfer protein [Stenotrophomonas]|jgi:type IV secretion system protein VirB9|uniref:TrbG/VirB9 family P-type conjugative transfer protein n=1 Tax=Stenotrophomonas TaxID=40323 RepID=UPI000C262ACB|nr:MULTISPECIES: TrbG/VirB9 family P-type conjugative transfer protein [Stenotrophomonas]MCF5089111.1 type IV secretion system protein VirB9 [Stenotrophomonas sp. PA-6-5C]MCO7469994.1 TrbG/VirB9 family P-type conjugative transfer protein [Stenotrophomonas maltophilia]PJL09874.1 type IV secretion system protein VirB9 [Stenotrophomonas maltophilia]
MSSTLQSLLRAGLALLLCVGAVAPAAAKVIEDYEYAPDRIYQVRTGLGITTQIELSPHEQILDYSSGFGGGWEISRRENVFYLKPKNVDVDTNLLVRTAAHSYIFELKVVATSWRALDDAKASGVQYKVRLVYPADTEFSAKKEKEADAPVAALDTRLVPGRDYYYGYDYTYKKRQPTWLVPSSVYDDRSFTYIRMGDRSRFPSGNFPAVFARDSESGDEFIVNSTVEGDTIVVHGTYAYLVVRHGDNAIALRRRPEQ